MCQKMLVDLFLCCFRIDQSQIPELYEGLQVGVNSFLSFLVTLLLLRSCLVLDIIFQLDFCSLLWGVFRRLFLV